MKLDEGVAYGRSLDECKHMLTLSENDLSNHILGASVGPAIFNAELNECKGSVISVDPIYGLSPEGIQERFDQGLQIYENKSRQRLWTGYGTTINLLANCTKGVSK